MAEEGTTIEIPQPLIIKTEEDSPLLVSAEADLALKVALQLYTYADFEKVKNPEDFAVECIERANKFVKAYNKKKNKIEKVK